MATHACPLCGQIHEILGIQETISTPSLSGPSSGKAGQPNPPFVVPIPVFSSLGHPIEYFFDWGRFGANSGWTKLSSFLKTWNVAGTYQVRVQARCAIHYLLSEWSTPLTVTISPVAVGALGTKTNPIPMNKDAGDGHYYFPSNGTGPAGSGVVPLFGENKVWFVVDTAFCKTQPVKKFDWQFKGYNNTTLVYSKIVQDKAGNDLTPEIPIANGIGDGYDWHTDDIVYPFATTRWLYAIEFPASNTEVWVIFYF